MNESLTMNIKKTRNIVTDEDKKHLLGTFKSDETMNFSYKRLRLFSLDKF